MKVVDLFSGLGGFSHGFLESGWSVERYDSDERFRSIPRTNIKDVFSIERLDADVIVASPPCEAFSVAAFGHHWEPGYVPATKHADMSIRLVRHTLDIIKESEPVFWVMENPRGMLRKIIGMPQRETWWCRWGDDRAKPTDLWGVFPPSLDFPPRCKNNNPDCHHQRARRGAKTGTQRRKGPAQRALIPIQFSRALAEMCERHL